MKVRSLPILLILLIISFLAKVTSITLQLNNFNEDDSRIKVNSFFVGEAVASTHNTGEAHGGGGHGDTKSNKDKKEKKDKGNNQQEAEKVIPTPEDQKFVNLNCNPELSKYSPEEIKLLQTLAVRRKEINKKEEDLVIKEKLLQAAELQLDAKVSNLKALKSEVENLLAQYNDKENQQVKSLVKIYETMKPQDAANIFNDLDMHILLLVISNMKETKVAPILSKMNPIRAREVSIEYANQKKLTNTIG